MYIFHCHSVKREVIPCFPDSLHTQQYNHSTRLFLIIIYFPNQELTILTKATPKQKHNSFLTNDVFLQQLCEQPFLYLQERKKKKGGARGREEGGKKRQKNKYI